MGNRDNTVEEGNRHSEAGRSRGERPARDLRHFPKLLLLKCLPTPPPRLRTSRTCSGYQATSQKPTSAKGLLRCWRTACPFLHCPLSPQEQRATFLQWQKPISQGNLGSKPTAANLIPRFCHAGASSGKRVKTVLSQPCTFLQRMLCVYTAPCPFLSRPATKHATFRPIT